MVRSVLFVAFAFLVAAPAAVAKTKVAVLKVQCSVDGATVAVDGKAVGKAPGEFEVKAGKHTVTVSAPGYQPFSQTLSVGSGKTAEVAVTLVKAGGAEGELDLDLEPLAPVPPPSSSGRPAASPSGGDELELEPLMPLEAPRSGTAGTAPKVIVVAPVSSGEAGAPSAVSATAVGTAFEPVRPWYKQYWVWAAAGAVLVGSSVAVVMLSRGDEQPDTADARYVIGSSTVEKPDGGVVLDALTLGR